MHFFFQTLLLVPTVRSFIPWSSFLTYILHIFFTALTTENKALKLHAVLQWYWYTDSEKENMEANMARAQFLHSSSQSDFHFNHMLGLSFFLNLLIFVLRFIKLSPHYYSRNAFILCCYRQNKICVSCSLPGCLSVAWEMWGDVWVRVSAFHGTVLQHCAAGGWIVESGVFPRRHKVMSCSCFVQTIGQSSYFLFSLL